MKASDNASYYQDSLRYRNEILETIINSSEAGVYVSDYNTGEILFANKKTADFIGGGSSAEELIGKTCWKALNKDTDERCEFCAYKRLIGKNGELLEPYSWERYFEEYGSWAKITNQAIRWVDGRIAQITTFHDISEIKKMQKLLGEHIRYEEQYKMQQNLQFLLDKLPVAIGITDVETTELVYVNGMFLKMFEHDEADAMIGSSVLTILPENSSGGVSMRQCVEEILDKKGVNAFEMEFITSTEKLFSTRLTTCVMEYNGRMSSVGIIIDMAAEKEQQRLLMQAIEREREANQLKSRFLAHMSHEIRTPLNAIMGMSEIIVKSAGDKEKTLDSVHKLMSSSRYLLSIVNDILDMAKIESGKFELSYEQFSLKSAIHDVIGVITQRCTEKNISFVSNVDEVNGFYLIGDKMRIKQVLINLLGNAVKFTGDYGEVRFLTEVTEETERTVSLKFAISDSGIGISQERLLKLFEPYEQGDSAVAVQYGGTGLGLSISKHLVSMMNGILRVDSKLGVGSNFCFEVRLDKGDNIELCDDETQEFLDLHGKRILLAEDVEINREIVCELLADTGVAIENAENGQYAVEMFEQSPEGYYGLIFMDIQMPVMDGYEATRRIRTLDREDAKSIPIITMTANAYKEDVERSLFSGMNGHLSKPIEVDVMMKVLREYLG